MTKKKSPIKEKLSCPYCMKLFTTPRGLNTHVGKLHKEEHEAAVAAEKAAMEGVLSVEEEKFCQLWASDREFFGNGVQSYIEAFDVVIVKGKSRGETDDNEMTYEAAKAQAHILLTNVDILRRINEIFESRGLNDEFVDKQLEVVITQNAEFSPKIKAISEYNKLKKRTTNSTVTVEHTFAKYDEMSDEELERALQSGEKFFKKL
jgi:hypothetical protein